MHLHRLNDWLLSVSSVKKNIASAPQSFLHLMSCRNLLGLPDRRSIFPDGQETESGIPCIDPGGGGWFGQVAEQSRSHSVLHKIELPIPKSCVFFTFRLQSVRHLLGIFVAVFHRELKFGFMRSIRAEIAHWLLFRSGACSAGVSSFCTDENTKELLQESMCGVMRLRHCVTCDHLSRESEPLVWDVCDLFGSVGLFDLDPRIQINPVKHPIQVHAAGSGDMFHGRSPALYHLDHVGEARSGKKPNMLLDRECADGYCNPRRWLACRRCREWRHVSMQAMDLSRSDNTWHRSRCKDLTLSRCWSLMAWATQEKLVNARSHLRESANAGNVLIQRVCCSHTHRSLKGCHLWWQVLLFYKEWSECWLGFAPLVLIPRWPVDTFALIPPRMPDVLWRRISLVCFRFTRCL